MIAWWALAVIVVIILPKIPALRAVIITLPGLQSVPAGLNGITLAEFALLLVVAWRFVMRAGSPAAARTTDAGLNGSDTTLALQVGLGIALLVLVFGVDARMSTLTSGLLAPIALDVASFVLVFALLGCAATTPAPPRPGETPQPFLGPVARVKTNLFIVGLAAFAVMLGAAFFDWLRANLHAHVAAAWFPALGFNVQNLLDILASVAVFVLLIAIAVLVYVLRLLARRMFPAAPQ